MARIIISTSPVRTQLFTNVLTTAEITYRMPDHLNLLQEFIWQDYDIAPRFPSLAKFLRFWEKNLEGPLYRVRVASATLVKPAELRFADGEFLIN